jgi:hypothetical protein
LCCPQLYGYTSLMGAKFMRSLRHHWPSIVGAVTNIPGIWHGLDGSEMPGIYGEDGLFDPRRRARRADAIDLEVPQ